MRSVTARAAPTVRTWLLFGLCSLVAVLTGCASAAAFGVPVQPLVFNGAGWLLGAALALGLMRVDARWTPLLLGLSVAALLLSLISPGLSSVHRWFAIGPLRLNAAELVLPPALAACAGLSRSSLPRILFPVVATVITALQPDASQAVATAVGTAVLLFTSEKSAPLRILLALVLGAAVVVSMLKPDPLAPVEQVEGIVLLANRVSPIIACLGVAGIAGSIAAPLFLARSSHASVRDAAQILTAYSAAAALASAFGAFPVPLMGIAVSPIIGAWLGLGSVMRVVSRTRRRE